MRAADRIETIVWNGKEITVAVWCDPTDIPFEGDCELEPGAEGWDIHVRAEIILEGQSFRGDAYLGSNWGRNKYILSQVKEVEVSAIADLEEQLKSLAAGREVTLAKERAFIARKFLYNNGIL